MAKYSVEAVDMELITALCFVRNVREALAQNRGRGLRLEEEAWDVNSPRFDLCSPAPTFEFTFLFESLRSSQHLRISRSESSSFANVV
jgi:hypothetical protein